MVVNLRLFCRSGFRPKTGVTALVWLGLLAFSLYSNASTDGAIGAWRSEVGTARILAENDTAAAYKEAQRLQENLPADATPADQVRLLNLLSRIELYMALTDSAAAH